MATADSTPVGSASCSPKGSAWGVRRILKLRGPRLRPGLSQKPRRKPSFRLGFRPVPGLRARSAVRKRPGKCLRIADTRQANQSARVRCQVHPSLQPVGNLVVESPHVDPCGYIQVLQSIMSASVQNNGNDKSVCLHTTYSLIEACQEPIFWLILAPF